MNTSGNFNNPTLDRRRVTELLLYDIMDTPDEEEFDDITKVAAYLFGAKGAQINFLDHDRQWTKSNVGWELKERPKEESICSHTIQQKKYLVVNDLSRDPRFKDRSYVQSKEIQFYAGVVLSSRQGYNIGTICVLDNQPRKVNNNELEALQVLAKAVEAQLELRLKRKELIKENKLLRKAATFLRNSTDVMMILNSENLKISDINGDVMSLLGYEAEEMNNTALTNYLLNGKFQNRFKEWIKSSAKGKFSDESIFITKCGKQLWLKVTVTKKRGQFFATARDITLQKQAEKHLFKQMEFTEDVLNHLPGIFFLIDSKGEMKRWNTNLEEVTQYSAEELKNKQYLELIDQIDHRYALESFQKVLTQGYRKRELKILSKDGKVIPYLLVSFKYEADDKSFVIGIGVDVTEEKRALKDAIQKEEKLQASLREKEILLNEVHHRVKNNLAIVSSLFQLDIFNTDDKYIKSVLTSSQMRIKSMALIHDSLYSHSDFANIQIDEYLKELTSTIMNTFTAEAENIELELNAENLTFNINQAIPLALLINELVINALKHAFPDVSDGKIGISLWGKDNLIHITIQDNGVGINPEIDDKNPETLGLTLISNWVNQLQGEMKVDRTKGTSVNICFKKEDAKGASANYIPT